MQVALAPHPQTPPQPVWAIDVRLEREGAILWLRFTVDGEVNELEWPLEQPPGRSDELWKHTCFEVFVRTRDGYVEYNLSPSSRWATYRFDGYRDGMREADEVATVLGMDAASDMVALEANIELPPGAEMLALSAVIEAEDGQKSYWALAHPSDKPDFHHPQSFVLELP